MIRRPPRSTLFPYTNALPISAALLRRLNRERGVTILLVSHDLNLAAEVSDRSEEHTSELQSQSNLVCRLLLEKKKKETSAPRAKPYKASLTGMFLSSPLTRRP